MICETCNHPYHLAGRCASCNCGEAEIVHATEKPTLEDEDELTLILSLC